MDEKEKQFNDETNINIAIEKARSWLLDCDSEQDRIMIMDATPKQIRARMNDEYCGGWTYFLEDELNKQLEK